jgi:transcriptional regulator with XRE-family HTH domain
LRERAGLTTRGLAEAISASSANVSNWERGERLPSEDRLVQILDATHASEEERERMIGLRRQADGPGQLVAGTPSIGEQLSRLIEYEQVARNIIDVAPLLIPGLLQTSDYARAMLRRHQDVDTRVALRVGRSDVITRKRQPAELLALIDSEVLVRPIVPPHLMADQLRHLLTMAAYPNVTIQLMPSTTPGYTPILVGPFILFEFATAAPIVHLEHYQSSAFLWDEAEISGFVTAVEEIRNVAMSPEETVRIITEIINGMEAP